MNTQTHKRIAMKMTKTTLALFSLLFLVASASHAQQNGEKNDENKKYKFLKEKTINKTYAASGNKLSINNSFGHVKFISSTGNEIKVNIHIEVSSDNEELAQKMFDRISVSDKQQGSNIEFKTSMSNSKNQKNDKCNNCKSNMHINYEVQLPVTVPLTVENSFGNIELPDYKAAVSLTSKFGKINAGNLADVKKLYVEFGKAEMGNLSNINAEFKFSKINITNLSGKNEIKMEFCDNSSIVLDNSIVSLQLKESYSTVNLKPTINLSASYAIKTSFGTVVDRSNAEIKRTDKPDEYGPDADREYNGQSGSGNAKIVVKSSFGKIVVGEPAAGDMDKKSDKNKNKNTNNNTNNNQSKNKSKNTKTVI